MGEPVKINAVSQNCDVVTDFVPANSGPNVSEARPVTTTRNFTNKADAQACLNVKGDGYYLVTKTEYDDIASAPVRGGVGQSLYFQILKRQTPATSTAAPAATEINFSSPGAFFSNEM